MSVSRKTARLLPPGLVVDAVTVGKDTLLRSVRAGADGGEAAAPRVIGIDDWAWKTGHRYGTIVCDLERHRVIDILPDRETGTVEAWLAERPGIEIVTRDRGGGYGSSVARALPDGPGRSPADGTCSRTPAGPSSTPSGRVSATFASPWRGARYRPIC